MARIWIFALLVPSISAPLALTAVGSAAANASCPLSKVTCEGGAVTSTDSVASCSGCSLTACSESSYDLPHGTFGAEVTEAFDGAKAGVLATDQYHVEGIPVGTPLSFFAELDVAAHLSGYCFTQGQASQAAASLREGASNVSSVSIYTPVETVGYEQCARDTAATPILRVSIARTAGEVFSLLFRLDLSQFKGGAIVSGTLRFSGLPPGASVVSCQGYRQDFVTASLPMTWGRLKARYR